MSEEDLRTQRDYLDTARDNLHEALYALRKELQEVRAEKTCMDSAYNAFAKQSDHTIKELRAFAIEAVGLLEEYAGIEESRAKRDSMNITSCAREFLNKHKDVLK